MRRLIVCCDGTTNDSESGNPVTNVARISRCIASHGKKAEQIVFYMPGIATGTSKFNNTYDALIGRGRPQFFFLSRALSHSYLTHRHAGISQDIREAYSFICNNFFSEPDEIVLIGFSRGAFTARAVASLINDVGLLTKRGLRHLPSLYRLWKDQLKTKDLANALKPLEICVIFLKPTSISFAEFQLRLVPFGIRLLLLAQE